jgi:hypothetical protein
LVKRLMDKIRKNNVVPVIGSQLLVGADGQTSLKAQVVACLMPDSGSDAGGYPPTFLRINEEVSLLKRSVGRHKLYDSRKENRMKMAPTAAALFIPAALPELIEKEVATYSRRISHEEDYHKVGS